MQVAQNLATRLIDLAFKPIENALINAFSGGGALRQNGRSAMRERVTAAAAMELAAGCATW